MPPSVGSTWTSTPAPTPSWRRHSPRSGTGMIVPDGKDAPAVLGHLATSTEATPSPWTGGFSMPSTHEKRVLVTGASGFIASWTQRRLIEQGHDVIGTSRYEHRPESRFVLGQFDPPLIQADSHHATVLRKVVRTHKPDVVIHLDAYVNPVALRQDPRRAIRQNFLQTVDVLDACRDHGVARVVFASSVAVLPAIRYQPIDAAHPLVTHTEGPSGGFYGAAKAASEVFGLTYADCFGLDFRVVRASAVFGFGMQWPIGIKPLVEGIVRGEEVTVAVHAPPRDYTPVQDAAAIFAAAAVEDDVADRVFYAATGRPLTDGHTLLDAMRAAFPQARLRVSDEPLDPTGIESRYRGVIDIEPVREQLRVRPAFSSLEDALVAYADRFRSFTSAGADRRSGS
ncbi:NAD(P)-dependent oxidoreductase [Georgenia yuyongxinii]|uniref:NAD(P)-dependent oxidoreductase n=2 Tax=Georgenia yuyongxinii TaxID=2589797 RepID=A0A552WV44_9MICO|nr:NAD(P)-dependent oxidoreductase [Georgenia yuyongxinii]